MSSYHKHDKKVTLTTGPIYVPPVNVILLNNKLIVTLKNPTHKKLEAHVSLGLCISPNAALNSQLGGGIGNAVQKYEVLENEIFLGSFKVDPMTCLRIEREFEEELLDSVIRLEATGDFRICKDSCQPICGLLEISSVVGGTDLIFSAANGNSAASAELTNALRTYYTPPSGVIGTDPQTHVPYANWVVCEDRHPCDSESESESCSESSSSSSHY